MAATILDLLCLNLHQNDSSEAEVLLEMEAGTTQLLSSGLFWQSV